MIKDKEYLKQYIRNFHKMEIAPEQDIEIEDFFNLDKPLTDNIDLVYNAISKYDDGSLFNEMMQFADDNFSIRESVVLLCLFRGMTYKQVGKMFNRTEHTIRRYEHIILDKFIEDCH